MPAIEEAQVFRIEALHPHAHPVEGKTAKHPGEGVVHIVGIRLHRDFRVGRNGIEAVYGLEDSLKIFGGKLRRGASAQVDGCYRFSFQIVFAQGELAAQGLRVAMLQPAVCGGVKVAIDATCLAKGDVDVNACHDGMFGYGAKVRFLHGLCCTTYVLFLYVFACGGTFVENLKQPYIKLFK